MKHIIVVDDRSKAGKNLLEIAEILAENDQSILLLNEEEDQSLLKEMLLARESGTLSASEKEKFLNQLREEAGL
ncbi:MAG: hypothetical protein WBA23_06680 [Tunicatimonas sp.]|uniref:hypothetical protein n=1 Tax=Tunicatimonas sp. TaxID=1940096 RepID=UPI003C784D34